MIWTILAILAVLVGLALVWGVLVKKFPQLKLIDLSTMARERHAQVKARIIHGRFDRALGGFGLKVNTTAGKAMTSLGEGYARLRTKLKTIEKSFEREHPLTPEEREAKIAGLLVEARANAKLERFGMAEEAVIESLKLDPKRVEAYRVLADIYQSQKLYEQAKQTLEYLIRLDNHDESAYERLGTVESILGQWSEAEASYLQSIGLSAKPALVRTELGEVYLKTGDAPKALEQFRAALVDEPYNPKYLDYFLETAILLGDAVASDEAYAVLETVNPENQKLAEFRARIDNLRQVK
jgi:tetratricopeptide (TPR) repeat protein